MTMTKLLLLMSEWSVAGEQLQLGLKAGIFRMVVFIFESQTSFVCKNFENKLK